MDGGVLGLRKSTRQYCFQVLHQQGRPAYPPVRLRFWCVSTASTGSAIFSDGSARLLSIFRKGSVRLTCHPRDEERRGGKITSRQAPPRTVTAAAPRSSSPLPRGASIQKYGWKPWA
eukprot:gene78-biopygen7006